MNFLGTQPDTTKRHRTRKNKMSETGKMQHHLCRTETHVPEINALEVGVYNTKTSIKLLVYILSPPVWLPG